jgi:hypothetical protein
MAGREDDMAAGAAGRGFMRASDSDREHVIEALKDAFVRGQLTQDELGARAGRALAARTCAELAALTTSIPPAPAPAPALALAGSARPLAPAGRPLLVLARRRPLARAAAGSGGCLAFAAAAVWATFILDPGPTGAERPWAGLILMLALNAVLAGVCILWSGVVTAMDQRLSARRLPPRYSPTAPSIDSLSRSAWPQ